MTPQQLTELHERIRSEAAGLTYDDAADRAIAAHNAATEPGATEEQKETYNEWWYICRLLNDWERVPGYKTYDPGRDSRPLDVPASY
jgi:hypothetical protein